MNAYLRVNMSKIPKFKIILAESFYLKDSIDILNGIISEATFKIDKDKIEIIELDPANVTMVIWNLLNSACIEYDVKESFKFGLNLVSLATILKNAKKNDIIELTNSEDNNISIWLKGNSIREYTIPLITLETKENKIPDLQFKTKVKIGSSLFNEQIKEAYTMSDSVMFNITNNLFEIKGTGDISKVSIKNKESDDVIISTDNNFESKYSIEYLLKIIKCKKISDEVTLEFGKDYPLKASYKLIDKLSFEWILAPRVTND